MTPKTAGPPDGGWGWVVAASAFAVNGLSYGVLRSLGLALPDLAEHFDRSAQDTAWVSALALAVQQAASPVGSALSTRWGARPVVMVGGALTSLGFIFSAFAQSLLHLYLGLGLLAGSRDTGTRCNTHSQTAAQQFLWRQSRKHALTAPQTPRQTPRRRHQKNAAPQTPARTGRTPRGPPSIPSRHLEARLCPPSGQEPGYRH